MRRAEKGTRTFLLRELRRGEKRSSPLDMTRVRHLAVFLSGSSIALILALVSAAVALAGGDGTHYP